MNKIYFIQKNIIYHIVATQVASDGGKKDSRKGNPKINIKNGKNYYHLGYEAKVPLLIKTIKLINSAPRCGINYFIEKNKGDQNGYPSTIVYFEIKINNKKWQVSFHTPAHQADELDILPSGRKTRWDKKKGGSYAACKELKALYKL